MTKCDHLLEKYKELALLQAILENHFVCVETLIHEGADVNTTDGSGNSILIHAARNGNSECVNLIVSSGADVNKTDKYSYTALTHAVKNGHGNCVELLTKAGADVNVEYKCGNIALIFAAGNNHTKCVDLLIQAGADVNLRNHVDHTALTYAASEGHDKCLDLLIKAGADVNSADNDNYTALTAAADSGSLKCVQLLLKAGAHVNTLNFRKQNTLIFLVEHSGSPNVAKFLFSAGEIIEVEKLDFVGIRRHSDIPEYLKEELSLKHLCRRAICSQLINFNPHLHLFDRVFHLGLPHLLARYLVYNMSLDDDTTAELFRSGQHW